MISIGSEVRLRLILYLCIVSGNNDSEESDKDRETRRSLETGISSVLL
jgi:hypothetical protein